MLEAHRSELAVLVSEPDGGIHDALNKGIRLASGDIVGFLHVVRKSWDDCRALRTNGVGGVAALAWKNLSKVPQFVWRS